MRGRGFALWRLPTAWLGALVVIAVAGSGAPALGLRGADARQSAGAAPARAAVESALRRSDGNISRAARDLGLSRQALYRRMEKLGLKTDT